MTIQLKNSDGNVIYSLEKSDLFPDYHSVLKEAISLGIDLSKLNVKNENLDNISFNQSKLSGACFQNCSMKKVEFVECGGDSVSIDKCNLEGVKFKRFDLNNMHIANSDLSSSRFKDSRANNVFIIDCNLSKSVFTKCILNNACFHTTNLFEVIFDGSLLVDSRFIHTLSDSSWVKDARFNYCEMKDCDLKQIQDISVLYIKESNIQDALLNNQQFTKIINDNSTILYAIDSDVVWWDSFRGNLENLKHEVENGFPTTHVDQAIEVYCYHELSRVCVYLEQWRQKN